MNIKVLETGAWDYNTSYHDEIVNFDCNLADSIVSFLKEKKIKNLIDFGCSTGYYLEHISKNISDIKLIGVEPNVSHRKNKHFDNILEHDLAHPFNIGYKGTIICLEVLEHIPKKFESIAIENIKNHCDGFLFLSWAIIGQGGYGHHNEKNLKDVINLFTKQKFSLLERETQACRDKAVLPWLKNNLLVFKYDRT